MLQVDINCDLGESFGNYTIGNDELIMPYISSANIACGFHAGDPLVMENTVKLALQNNINIGAHPGYPDLQGFGRRSIKMSATGIRTMLVYQIAALKGITESLGGKLVHVKPHGALYNDAVCSEEIAKAVIEAVLQIDPSLKLFALAGSYIHELAQKQKLGTVNEVFADRAYMPSGELAPRSMDGAVIHDAEISKRRVLQMIKNNKAEAVNGEIIEIKAESVCIHGDNPEAIEMAKSLHQFLNDQGVQIKGC
jgi:UPF0271 protein